MGVRFNWAPYQPATYCSHKAQPGNLYLAAFIEEQFPETRLLNIESCRDIVGGDSLSHHAEGRADDVGVPQGRQPSGVSVGEQIVEMLGPHGRELGIDHIIANLGPWLGGRGQPRTWSASTPMGRIYTGPHPHKDHNHIGLTRVGARDLTLTKLRTVVLGAGPPKPEPVPIPVPPPKPVPIPVPPITGEDMIPTKQSAPDNIRFFQELLNDTYDSTLELNGRWGDGMDTIIQEILVPLTNDPDPEVKAGSKVNARQWKTLWRDWIRKTAG